jgi:hypothetical protein
MASRQSDLNLNTDSKIKLESSRMFLPKQHCAPYIGQPIIGNAIQAGWVDVLEVNSIKREN